MLLMCGSRSATESQAIGQPLVTLQRFTCRPMALTLRVCCACARPLGPPGEPSQSAKILGYGLSCHHLQTPICCLGCARPSEAPGGP
eukprot:1141087-Pelagomonas_calceolata.AAC.8